MKNYKKRSVLNNAVRGAAAVILVMIVIPSCYLIFFVRDIPRIDDSSMKITRVKVPPDRNAYNLIIQAQMPLNDIVFERSREELKRLSRETVKIGGLSPESRRKAMQDFKERLEMIERSSTFPYSQGPQLSSPGDRIPNYISLLDLAKLRLEIAMADFKAGRKDKAIGAVESMLRFGNVVQLKDGGTCLISIMIGIAIKGRSLAYLNEMMSEGWLPEKGDRGLDTILADSLEKPEPWVTAWKSEYLLMGNILDDLKKFHSRDFKYIGSADITPNGNAILRNDYSRYFLFKLFLRPEKTRKLLYDFDSGWVRDSNTAYYKDMRPMDISMYTKLVPDTAGLVRSALKGDLGTNYIVAVAIPNFIRAFQKKYYLDFQIEATRLRIAALEYKRDNKQLPPTLAALVPDYISTVPADPFDGNPIRYDAARALIWSVGMDLKDDGGAGLDLFSPEMNKDKWQEQKDYVLKIE
jgi:hypothetical protein